MNWISTGKYVWCVERQRIITKGWSEQDLHVCEGPHRPVAVLLHSPDEYRPKEREVTMEIEADETARFLCTTPEHVARKLVCTRAAKGFAKVEYLKVENVPAAGMIVKHNWEPLDKVIEAKAVAATKPIPKEETTSSVPVETNTVYTEVKVDPVKWYCHAFEHRRDSCAIDGYVVKPDAQHTKRGDGVWVQGRRSTYVVHRTPLLDGLIDAVEAELAKPENVELLEQAGADVEIVQKHSYARQVAESIVGPDQPKAADELVTTGEYLHGKSNGQVFTPPKETPSLTRQLYAGTMNGPSDGRILQVGDEVLVRGKITAISDHGPSIDFQVRANEARTLAVKPQEVLCWVRPRIPHEPHPGHLLVSGASGRVFQYSVSFGDYKAGWHDAGVVGGQRYTWEELWVEHAPFREFYASRPVRVDE